MARDLVAALRQPAELGEDVAADRVEGVGVDRELDPGVLEVAERDVAAHVPVAVGEPPQRDGARVGLVLDLADDLLEDVLDGDDPDRAPVLVGDDPDRASAGAAARRAGRRAASSRGRPAPRGSPARSRRRRRRSCRGGRGCCCGRRPRTLSGLSSSITTSRVWPEETQRRSAVLDRLVGVHGDHGGDRRHHLARLLLVQVKDAAEHHRLAGVEACRPWPRSG